MKLVHHLRDDVAPPLEHTTGAKVLVSGATAASQDVSETLANRLPLFVAVVVGVSSLLLRLVFRSIWIPVKAAILNLLSISAALGVITLVFQHGWFGAQPGPIEAFIPALIFAIVFGLSMDYEVFLISRIHEEWTLLDAVVIRCLIVPAVMQMPGTWAWWLPAPLARNLPKVSIERPEHS